MEIAFSEFFNLAEKSSRDTFSTCAGWGAGGVRKEHALGVDGGGTV